MKEGGPVVVLPEGTTGNGRGLLRFGKGIGKGIKVPMNGGKVWIVYFRHPPPSTFTPTPTHTIPSTTFNPIPHMFTQLLPTFTPRTISIKFLHPHCSPSSGDFLPSKILNLASLKSSRNFSNQIDGKDSGSLDSEGEIEVFAECCSALMIQLGRAKQVGMGWEDKAGFLKFVDEKKTGSARRVSAGKKRS